MRKTNLYPIFSVWIAAVCMLSGCGIYKSYERPQDIQAPDQYRIDQLNEVKSEADTLSASPLPSVDLQHLGDSNHIGFADWRDMFTDPQLQRLIERGLDSNFDLRNAVLQVRQMRARLVQARLAFTPTLNGNGSEGFSGIIDMKDPSNAFSLGASASWEIDVFGKLLNAKRGAVANFLQSEAGRRSLQTQIIASIATAYYTLLMLDVQLEISEQTVINWNTSIRMMEAMKTAGMYNQSAVEQAKANSLAVKAGIPDIKRQIRELENDLSLLLGMPGQPIERGSFEAQMLPVEFSAGIPSQLFLSRPDIIQAETQLMAAYAGTAAARAAFLPGFNITANGNWTNTAGTAILDPAKFVWQAVASLTLPIFNRGINRANLQVAKAQQEITANNFKKAILIAANEVSNALFRYQAAGVKVQYRTEQIASLEKAVSYTTQLMQLGGTTYLEVLTAQQSLLQARLACISAQHERSNSVITLYRALGGGSLETIPGIGSDNYNTPKAIRQRTKAAEKQVKALVKEEKAAARIERKRR